MVFFLAFLIMGLIMAAMALGALAGRGPLKGSCGGLSALGIEGRCEICGDYPGSCDKQKTPAHGSAAFFYDVSHDASHDANR